MSSSAPRKSGTTTLYRWISEHPFVTPCSVKETHYFSNYYTRGRQWYDLAFVWHPSVTRPSASTSVPFITGEASPLYIPDYWGSAANQPRASGREADRDHAKPGGPGMFALPALTAPGRRAVGNLRRSAGGGGRRLAGEDAGMRTEPFYRSMPFGNWSYMARGRYAEKLEKW